MALFSLVRFTARGLSRRRVRTILTIVGLAALILTFLTVQSLVSTLEVNLSGSVSSLGGEIDVWSKGASYPLISKIPLSYAGTVRNIPGVAFATPVALALLTVDSGEALIAGIIPSQLHSLLNYTMVSGAMISTNETGTLAIGKSLSVTVGKGVGETVQLNGLPYRVSGVYVTDSWMDYSIIIPHSVVQQMVGMVNGTSMVIAVAEDPGNINNLIGRIRSSLPAVEAFRSSEAPAAVSPIFASVRNIAMDITLIVTLGAVLGITNSNLNNLRERMRAFAIFKAAGASYGQIIKLVIYESLFLGAMGTVLGLGMSYAILRLISVPVVENFSVGIILVPSTFLYAAVLGLSVSLIAAVYPALRVARVRPQEVFRFG